MNLILLQNSKSFFFFMALFIKLNIYSYIHHNSLHFHNLSERLRKSKQQTANSALKIANNITHTHTHCTDTKKLFCSANNFPQTQQHICYLLLRDEKWLGRMSSREKKMASSKRLLHSRVYI